MIRKKFAHAVFLPRTFLSSLLALVGLTSIIVGILAMHVWMGGHGSAFHHAAGPTTAGTTSSSSSTSRTPVVGVAGHSHTEGEGHPAAVAVVLAAVTEGGDGAADGSLLAGCGGVCTDEMMLGMCVLAMIVVGIIGLLIPAGRALLSTSGRRGPPVLSWVSRPAPAPSLTRLCISRT